MTTDVAVCTPGDPIAVVAETLSARRVRRLPVVDPSHRLVGLVSLHDLAARVDEPHGQGPTSADLARTLKAVCAPRARHPTP
jgi:CBS domain-containing protein